MEEIRLLQDPTREVYAAEVDGEVRGFIILNMRGAFVGYIQTVCVDATARGGGLGTRLMEFAERSAHSVVDVDDGAPDASSPFLAAGTSRTRRARVLPAV